MCTMPPGRGAGTVVFAPGVPSAARTPTWKARGGAADSAAAAAGGGRLPGGRTGARAGWGAEARAPPARSRGLQYPQRRWRWCCASSGLPRRSPSSPTGGARRRGGAPGSPPPAGWLRRSGTAAGLYSRCAPAQPGTPHCATPRAAPRALSLRCAMSLCLVSPLARPHANPWCLEITTVETLGGHPRA